MDTPSIGDGWSTFERMLLFSPWKFKMCLCVLLHNYNEDAVIIIAARMEIFEYRQQSKTLNHLNCF